MRRRREQLVIWRKHHGPGSPNGRLTVLWCNADEKKDTGPRYDIRFEWGDGPHSDVHGGWLLPGILRWTFGK